MRIHQSWKNYVAQVVLQRDVPLVTAWFRDWLVDLHADFFVEHSEQDGEARRPHFEALFDASLDVYQRALDVGYPEAEAREITHVQATWDFQNHGWGDLIEFPPEEREAYYRRYQEFFDRHDCTPTDPFGDFAPEGLPEAPSTPERMQGEYPFAVAGLTDDVYVVSEQWEVRLHCGEESGAAATAD